MVAKKTVKAFAGYDHDAISSMMDRGANVLYRWIRIPATTECPGFISCFSAGRLQIGDDTNLNYPNVLQPPESFLVRSIHSYWLPGCDPADRADLSEYRADLKIAHKIFFSSPVIGLTDLGVIMPKLPKKIDRDTSDFEREMQQIRPGLLGEYIRIIPCLVPFDVTLTGRPFRAKGDIAYCMVLNGWWDRGIE